MCERCKSTNVRRLRAEICIHFLGLANLDTPGVFVFPELIVCLNCGESEFLVSEEDLRLIRQRTDQETAVRA